MENKTEVHAYKVTRTCDSCNEGSMEFTGHTFLSSPPQYDHKCDNCGAKKVYRKKYPCIEHS